MNSMLEPGKCKYFAWSDPADRRILEWWPKSFRNASQSDPIIYQNELNEVTILLDSSH